ncbi:cupin domain-containing protein [Gracilibacillus phocaeensis]|uniref:cupin domain-containing protein n=1 Tax=Gracilibacillus phocaeensis TaxID=2042304 RepID=UPI00102F69C7|nr:cupin domain-containing protein [Gracilibacillus phocaeensis]
MAVLYIDYQSPNNQFYFDLRNNPFFQRDQQNFINAVGRDQVNTLGNASILDIYLSQGKYVEPHIHQNASEIVYCVSGAAIVSFINPFTNQLHHIPIQPGQIANVPQGFWHYEVATVDDTHLLAIFDAPYPQAIFGSDILRLTPSEVMANSYCLDKQEWQEAVEPIKQTVIIGPPDGCQRQETTYTEYLPYTYPYTGQTSSTFYPTYPYYHGAY